MSNSPGAPGRAGPSRPRRSRLVAVALLTLPLLELVLLIAVGRAIGVLATLALLAAGAVAGGMILYRVGARAARRFADADGRATPVAGPDPDGVLHGVPTAPTDGRAAGAALLVPVGLLLLLPGFLSDLAGLALLVPAVRRTLATRLSEAVLRRIDHPGVRIVPGEVVTGPTAGQGTDVRRLP
jgi:UPF0716 protein FxsA